MKKLYFIFFLTIGFLGNAQIVNIPDASFKAKLLSARASNQVASSEIFNYVDWSVSSYSSIDSNGDNEIQVSEAETIKYLDLEYSNIVDLTGIEAFSNLIFIKCSYNQLSNLDISSLINLKYLICAGNQLPSLNVSTLTNLLFLDCSDNQFLSLNISSLINLQHFDCSRNQILSLNISALTNLQHFNCSRNQLPSLNVSTLTTLQYLYCSDNQLTTINVLPLINLQYFDCSRNQLSSLNLSNLSNLWFLDCIENQLSSLNVLGLTNLKSLYCSQNQLSILNVLDCINLEYLYCNSNQLSSLDVSGLKKLIILICSENQLNRLFLKNNNNSWFNLEFYDNLNLQYICADEEDIDLVQQKINQFWYFSNCHVNTYCSFTPGGTFYEVSGNTKYDFNNNGCDVTDINYSNLNFSITDGTNTGSLIADQTGNYYIPIQAGSHTITPNLENPSYFNISPTSFTVNFPSQTSPFTQDFCVTANGVKSDVEVILLPTTPARPGFDAVYKLVYRNNGNQVENGNISLTFDDTRLDYVSSNPVYNSSTLNNFTWIYNNLQPFETREIQIVFNVNSPMETPAVNIGETLFYAAIINITNSDETPIDNYFLFEQIVVGSYDPNDKTCLQGVTEDVMIIGDYVHYLIRFENTGTFPAENIVVKDMIDLAKFDITTLVPLKSSHDFYTRITGNKVEFIFENINLDFNDATNDCYVVFKIKTKPSLIVGDIFTNNANIYFDYNFPITTNTYATTITALSSQDFDFGTYFTLYPNPAKEVLNIQSKQGVAINSVEIYNQLGQIVMATTNAVNTIDVANLASGTYFVKVNTDKGSANAKFVKE